MSSMKYFYNAISDICSNYHKTSKADFHLYVRASEQYMKRAEDFLNKLLLECNAENREKISHFLSKDWYK